MAKKDQTNGTPIEFQIPSAGGKGPRVPIPINQRKWKYKSGNMARLTLGEWAVAIVAFFVMLGVGFLLSVESWALTVALWVVALIITGQFDTKRNIFPQKPERPNKAKTSPSLISCNGKITRKPPLRIGGFFLLYLIVKFVTTNRIIIFANYEQ